MKPKPKPNTQLRAAREATPSPRVPGAHLSRQELAEAVNAWCAVHGTAGALDEHYIGRLEQGRVRWPGRDYRAAFRAVLGASDAELGFTPSHRRPVRPLAGYPREGGEEDEDMRRRVFLAAASAALFARPDISGATEWGSDGPVPSWLGATDVAALRDMATQLRTMAREHDTYGGLLVPTVNRAERLLDVPATDDTRRDLLAVTGELHRMAGWVAYDAQAEDDCWAHLGRAMELSSAADDAYGAAFACVLAGTETGEHGHPADALRLFRMAQGRLVDAAPDDPRVPGLEARLHADAAHALVGIGDNVRARNELAAAHDWTPTSAAQAEGLAFKSALVERELADLDAAEEHAKQASRPRGAGPDRRAPLFSRITLAELRVSASDSSGATLAEHVIRDVDGVRSARVRSWLDRLVTALDDRGERELAHEARRVAAST
ncbi:MAG: hypothetical protein ACRDQ5_19245 [Sciscionella sp.]